jgi:histidine triad (HIT) family protein
MKHIFNSEDNVDDCIFCKIARKELPAEIVYETDSIIAFKDINPQAPVHVIIIPVQHYDNILTVPAGSDLMLHIQNAINKLAIKYKLADNGFRIVNNCGADGGQTVNHLHFHLLGGRAFKWPPG